MKLIRGTALTPEQRTRVLSTFVHRYTVENPHADRVPGNHARGARKASDSAWLAQYAFWFRQDGCLAARRHAEPCYLCDS